MADMFRKKSYPLIENFDGLGIHNWAGYFFFTSGTVEILSLDVPLETGHFVKYLNIQESCVEPPE